MRNKRWRELLKALIRGLPKAVTIVSLLWVANYLQSRWADLIKPSVPVLIIVTILIFLACVMLTLLRMLDNKSPADSDEDDEEGDTPQPGKPSGHTFLDRVAKRSRRQSLTRSEGRQRNKVVPLGSYAEPHTEQATGTDGPSVKRVYTSPEPVPPTPASIAQIRPKSQVKHSAAEWFIYLANIAGLLAVLSVPVKWFISSGLEVRQAAAEHDASLDAENKVICEAGFSHSDITALITPRWPRAALASITNYAHSYCMYRMTLDQDLPASLMVSASCNVEAREDWAQFTQEASEHIASEPSEVVFQSHGQGAGEMAALTSQGMFIKVNLALDVGPRPGEPPSINGYRNIMATVLRRTADNLPAKTACLNDGALIPKGSQ